MRKTMNTLSTSTRNMSCMFRYYYQMRDYMAMKSLSWLSEDYDAELLINYRNQNPHEIKSEDSF